VDGSGRYACSRVVNKNEEMPGEPDASDPSPHT